MSIRKVPSPASRRLPEAAPGDAYWLRRLLSEGPDHDIASAQLHQLLIRISHQEALRRAAAFGMSGPEVDDLAEQAAGDALLSVLGKLADFRGDSKFTTWAAKFAIFEVAGKFNRHHWRRGDIALGSAEWDQLPARFGMQPDDEVEWRDLMAALRRAVAEDLTERQRAAFVAIVVQCRPLDLFSAETGTNRNAVYKVLFDARRKLHDVLVERGYLGKESRPLPRRRMVVTGWAALDLLLDADPRDSGCEHACEVLDVYAELFVSDPTTAHRRRAEVAAHLRACGPCAEDFEGLLEALARS